MRLIDSDEFKEIILTYGKAGYRALPIEKISGLIDSQSTSYDVDKVVERSEDMKYVMMGNYGVRREVVNFEDLIEVVKSGGID